MSATDRESRTLRKNRGGALGFLLAQVGAHAAQWFAERIRPLGLTPPHAGILRLLAGSPGVSQRGVCTRLSILPSRLVILVDELEKKELIERRDDPEDRRSYALHLTAKGRKVIGSLSEIARDHGDAMSRGLTPGERTRLTRLLSKVVAAQGLIAGVHPGYKRAGEPGRTRKEPGTPPRSATHQRTRG